LFRFSTSAGMSVLVREPLAPLTHTHARTMASRQPRRWRSERVAVRTAACSPMERRDGASQSILFKQITDAVSILGDGTKS
jgi:hypothetical protein